MAVNLARPGAASALNTTNDLAQAGAVFNDATRLLDGGLWSQPADNTNQMNYLDMYRADITAVQNDLTSALANGATGATINGAPAQLSQTDTALLNKVQTQLTTLLNAAPNSIGANAGQAQAVLHDTQTAILNEINGDTPLANALHGAAYTANTGATDNPFQALAAPVDAVPGDAAHGNLAQIGAVFNNAANLAVGGLSHQNIGQFTADMQGVAHGIQNILNNPAALAQIEQGQAPADAALTTIHLQTLENQANLQLNQFDHQLGTTVGARGTNDNILDMIDIVQGDAALNAAAGNGGNVSHNGGFASQPGYLTGTITHFQDNQAQTNFWSQFVSESNTLNTALQNVANGTHATAADIAALQTDLNNYQSFSTSFAAGQNGVFSARFNNELVNGTVNADTAAALHGLQGIANGDMGAALAADQAQITAAGMGFAANAADVSGNNTPLGGMNYVATATTVATATNPNGLAMGTIPVAGAADPATGLAATTAAQAAANAATPAANAPAAANAEHQQQMHRRQQIQRLPPVTILRLWLMLQWQT